MENFLKINKRVYPSIWDLRVFWNLTSDMHYCHSRCINNENLTYFTNRQFDVSLGNSLCFYKDYIECHMKNNRHSELFETIGIVSLCKLNSQEPNDVKNDCKIILTEWPTATVKVRSLHCKKWENTVRRKFEYGVFQITNAKNLVKFVRSFWHEWFGKPNTPISDLTVHIHIVENYKHK